MKPKNKTMKKEIPAAVALADEILDNVIGGLDYTSFNLSTASDNVPSADTAFRDADMAKDMATFTENNILLQTAQSMLSQANQLPQGTLELLQ